MFKISSKYFSFFSNRPPANWVAHITDFLTCYSSLYYIPWPKVTKAQTKKTKRKRSPLKLSEKVINEIWNDGKYINNEIFQEYLIFSKRFM